MPRERANSEETLFERRLGSGEEGEGEWRMKGSLKMVVVGVVEEVRVISKEEMDRRGEVKWC